MRNIRIMLVPKFMTEEELREAGIEPTATVEAEYGQSVIKGKVITLAHHAKEYEGNPAPCNTPDVPVLEDGSTIVISHIDLDTLGGIAALLGIKKDDPAFWQAAEFLDLNGYHHLHEVPEDVQEQYVAFCAWNSRNRGERVTGVTDVTEQVLTQIAAIDKAIDRDEEMIRQGDEWREDTERQIEECLVYENEHVRVFNSPNGVFCNAAYYSKKLGMIVPATVAYNGRFKAITMALADGGKELSSQGMETARELVQKLWGMEAGGHPGIAGSPRGKEMTQEDLLELAKLVEEQMIRLEDAKKKPKVSLRKIADQVEEAKETAAHKPTEE